MIFSMTGYASASRDTPGGALSLELKAVNGRFLEMQFRLPEELRSIEPQLRELIGAKLTRGKVDCRGAIAAPAGTVPAMELNQALLTALADVSRRVQAQVPGAAPLSVAEVLNWPGMFGEDASAGDKLRQDALELARTLLADFAASRAREGEKLAGLLLERVARMETLLAEIQPRLPEAIAAYQQKITSRLQEALGGSDEERVRQEIALFGIKVDVAEELDRLGTHLAEVRRILGKGGPAGKRLDFLMQELHREANTLGSKSVSKEISDASLEFKLLIEQMREQVQNIE
ncbi:MAG TPA: YicC/YloC family endoribonuclease [Burkholderiales bacterium]|nr:YicC/YloC family endoribonuclease [Burkholderiales bacterium]